MNTVTPGEYVKAFAKIHSDLEAEVKITSLIPKGKGGWGTTSKMTTFYIRGGKAAQTRGKWGLGIHNGWCEVCGRIHLDLVVMTGHLPDPDAGRIITHDELAAMEWASMWPGYTYKFSHTAHVMACPECVRENGLDISRQFSIDWDEENKVRFVRRPHPQLRKFQYPPVTVLIDLLADPVTVQVVDRRQNTQ